MIDHEHSHIQAKLALRLYCLKGLMCPIVPLNSTVAGSVVCRPIATNLTVLAVFSQDGLNYGDYFSGGWDHGMVERHSNDDFCCWHGDVYFASSFFHTELLYQLYYFRVC